MLNNVNENSKDSRPAAEAEITFLTASDCGRATISHFNSRPTYRPRIAIQDRTIRTATCNEHGMGNENFPGIVFIGSPKASVHKFRFSIQMLLAATTIVAMLAAVWIYIDRPSNLTRLKLKRDGSLFIDGDQIDMVDVYKVLTQKCRLLSSWYRIPKLRFEFSVSHMTGLTTSEINTMLRQIEAAGFESPELSVSRTNGVSSTEGHFRHVGVQTKSWRTKSRQNTSSVIFE